MGLEPATVARFTRIEPVTPDHYDFLYRLSVDPRCGYRWRYRGTTPSPDEFVAGLWRGVACQFAARSLSSGALVAHVSAHDPDLSNGVISASICIEPTLWEAGWPLEAAALFVDYVFRCFAVRKIYFEAAEFNAQHFANSIGRLLDHEGAYRERLFYAGEFWDVLILSLSRTRWQQWRDRFLPTLGAETDGIERTHPDAGARVVA